MQKIIGTAFDGMTIGEVEKDYCKLNVLGSFDKFV